MTQLDNAFLERFATAAVQEGSVDASYDFVESPIGSLLVVQTARGVARIAFGDERVDEVLWEVGSILGPRIVRSKETTEAVTTALHAYLAGDDHQIGLKVDLSLVRSDFQRRVLQTLARRVPRGRVTTYGRLAEQVGHPGAARAAGTALARNPIPIVLPCHRVVPSSGGLGNYGGGVERKRWLLELEGASF